MKNLSIQMRMNVKSCYFRSVLSSLLILALFSLSSCNEQKQKIKSSETLIIEEAASAAYDADLEKAKEIIYSLPSPLETAMLLKRSKASYNETLLNPHSKSDDYSTQKLQAINMGIYLADLCYASIHEQNQTTIHYMLATQDIAKELGLMNLIDEDTKERLEDNYYDRDSVIYIISEALMNSNAFLQDNGHSHVHSLVLYGGWLEGLYLASEMAKESSTLNMILYQRILDQGISVEIIEDMLSRYQSNAQIAEIGEDIKKLEKRFTELGASMSEKVFDESISEEVSDSFNILFELISKTRNKYTS
jgi:hypothetical protein